MGPISTRLARPGDEGAVAELHIASWRVGYRGVIADEVLDDEGFAERRHRGWRAMIVDGDHFVEDNDQELWVATLDDVVSGFALVGAEEGGSGLGELHGFYVHPDAWGSGVADALMERSLEHLRRRFERALLWTLRDTPRSRRFYERHGWTCGAGGDQVIDWWSGPHAAPPFPEPIANIQYRHRLDR